MKTMKAMLLKEFGKPLVLEEVPIPEPGPGEVRIKLKACGVCATDIKTITGKMPFVKEFPFIAGHENAGVIDKFGEGTGQGELKLGDRVCIFHIDSCGECWYCKHKLPAMCRNIRGLIGMSRNGGFAEYLVAPEKCLVPIPDNITFEQAAVATDSVTTAVHALMERLDVQEGDPVLIMGVGGLGSNGIQIAKHMGAKVIAADIDDEKLAMAKDLGADYVFNTTKVDLAAECRRVTDGMGVKWSADFAGQPIATQTALSCLAPEGVQAQPGYSVVKPTFEINSFALVSNEIEIRGSRGPTVWSCRKSIELVSSGAVNPQIDPQHTGALEDLNWILDDLAAGKVAGRAVIKYD